MFGIIAAAEDGTERYLASSRRTGGEWSASIDNIAMFKTDHAATKAARAIRRSGFERLKQMTIHVKRLTITPTGPNVLPSAKRTQFWAILGYYLGDEENSPRTDTPIQVAYKGKSIIPSGNPSVAFGAFESANRYKSAHLAEDTLSQLICSAREYLEHMEHRRDHYLNHSGRIRGAEDMATEHERWDKAVLRQRLRIAQLELATVELIAVDL